MEDKKNNAIEKVEEIANDTHEEKKRKREKKDKKKKGLITAVIVLAIMTATLSVLLTFNYIIPNKSEKALENEYRRSFYDTVEQVDNMDLNMSKIMATSDNEARQIYLVDLAVNSELCERDLGELPLDDENKFYTTKLVNQIGDFAKYLNKKCINNEKFSNGDKETLRNLYKGNLALKESLVDTLNNMEDDFYFSSALNKNQKNIMTENFNKLQEMSVSFPELIYDGPFSDGLENREIVGLSEYVVSNEDAEKIFIDIYNDTGIENVERKGELNGIFECYNFTGKVGGKEVFAEISKRDGKLILASSSGSCKDTVYTDSDAENSAIKFLKRNGIENMKAVWSNLSNNVYTINFCTDKSGIIIYPEMVKIRVCAETNTVIGYDATAYYLNKTERGNLSFDISEERAKQNVSENVRIVNARKCVIPIGVSGEKFCYEFCGEMDGATYYIYIDGKTGKQVQIFKVIESGEGELLM